MATKTPVRERNLTAPWMEEFRAQLISSRRASADPSLDFAVFDQLDNRLHRAGLTVDRVLNELRQGIFGAWLLDSDSPDRRFYQLMTRKLEVRLHTEPSRNHWGDITVLDRAYRRRDAPKPSQMPVYPSNVTLHNAADTPSCDLDTLIEEVNWRRWLFEAEETLTTVRLTPRLHTQLRDDVRRRFGSLRTLLELAKQRAEKGDKATAEGTLLDGAQWFGRNHKYSDEVVVRLDKPSPFQLQEDPIRLAIWPTGDMESSVVLQAADIVDEIVVFSRSSQHRDSERLQGWARPGLRVVVSESGEFRYRRHLTSLYQFLDEKTAGNWTALAIMLCHPEQLAHRRLTEIRQSGRKLNQQQRLAVAGALDAPHAYFVQGPPGTGKTQVITEVASRLVARGERVLLTAPTHVALDEVLQRLADEPGVLPLRLSWNDKYVADDVQRFTLSGYDAVVSGTLRIPSTSKLPQWNESLSQAQARLGAVDGWLASQAELDSAEKELAAARQNAMQRAKYRHDHIMWYEVELGRLLAWMRHHSDELGRIDFQEREIAGRLALIQRERGWFGRFLDRIGVGEMARLEVRAQRLQQVKAATTGRYQDAYRHRAEQEAARDRLVTAGLEQAHADQAVVAAAERRREAAAAAQLLATQSLSRLGLGELLATKAVAVRARRAIEAEHAELAARIAVQQQWFEIIGADGTDAASDLAKAQAVLGKALSSAANLICSTTAGFGGAKTFRDLDYDTLIVDEASKVTAAEFLIPALRAHRWILVGDEKQLAPYVDAGVEHHIHAMAAIHLSEREAGYDRNSAVKHLSGLWRAFEDAEQHPFREKNVEQIADRLVDKGTWAGAHRQIYAEQVKHLLGKDTEPERHLMEAMREHLVTSLFQRCVAHVDSRTGPRSRLIEQRRMPAEIAELVREPVYGGNYKSPPPSDPDCPQPLLTPSFSAPLVFLDTSKQAWPWDDLPHGTTSFINNLEADWVVEVCRRWNDELGQLGIPGRTSISVLAFYGAQARLIRQKLGYPRYPRFPHLAFRVVDSIDRIQGQQSDIVVISFCRTFGRPKDPKAPPRKGTAIPTPGWAPWLQNINRLNVACTRACRSLVLVGHGPTLRALRGTPKAEQFFTNMFALEQRGVLEINIDWATAAARKKS
ncbi:hypothetical protein Rhe02_63410 [Rhizocola hellebori]|uniref:Uncharacterized protein n=1 Tax=Rhizocola hellebori TaxID=1392758 RepID=A0A8J3VID2_9ACTN|nr:AAA domain-containing protein [Rhizocola hellebori]GIH08274.1 hypothetical protein Rhe02_63410 [Rhizocola hellebori]